MHPGESWRKIANSLDVSTLVPTTTQTAVLSNLVGVGEGDVLVPTTTQTAVLSNDR